MSGAPATRSINSAFVIPGVSWSREKRSLGRAKPARPLLILGDGFGRLLSSPFLLGSRLLGRRSGLLRGGRFRRLGRLPFGRRFFRGRGRQADFHFRIVDAQDARPNRVAFLEIL